MFFWGPVVVSFFLFLLNPIFAFAQSSPKDVDMVVVLAVDVSDSVDEDEYALQKQGIVDALLNDQFRDILEQCNDLGMAITYMEWSGHDVYPNQSAQLVGWTHLMNGKDILQFADKVLAAPRLTKASTDIELALLSSEELIENNPPYSSVSKYILLSSDGFQNVSPRNSIHALLPTDAAQKQRDQALYYTSRRLQAKGYKIRGLPIYGALNQYSEIDLENYFLQNITDGESSSVRPINSFEEYSEGLLEILLRIANQCIS